jgi:HSP20 family molecular chaperone IbpA
MICDGRRSRRLAYAGPAIDVEETAEVIFVRTELPGFAPATSRLR